MRLHNRKGPKRFFVSFHCWKIFKLITLIKRIWLNQQNFYWFSHNSLLLYTVSFYLETPKNLKKYASYKKNIRNKNYWFSGEKSDTAKIYPNLRNKCYWIYSISAKSMFIIALNQNAIELVAYVSLILTWYFYERSPLITNGYHYWQVSSFKFFFQNLIQIHSLVYKLQCLKATNLRFYCKDRIRWIWCVD